jgi:hypothetical protein
MTTKRKRISLYYSTNQWSKINERVKLKGRKTAQSYIINQINELHKTVLECEDCFNNDRTHEKRVYSLPNSTLDVLNKLSEKTGLPPSTIVSRFIINPLLIT